MKSTFLIITIVFTGAPFLILSANASQFNGTYPNNRGGMINDTGGFSCVTTTHCNTTAGVFLNKSGPHDLAACNGHICEQTPMPSNQIENHKCIEALTPVLGLHHANQTCKTDGNRHLKVFHL